MDTRALLTTYGGIVFPLFFVALWVTVCRLLARFGGWRALAEQYPLEGDPGCDGWKWCRSAQLGPVTYTNTLILGFGPQGLVLKSMVLFRPGHRTIRVPWSDLRVTEEQRFLWTVTVVTFARCPKVRLRVTRDITRVVADGSRGRWPKTLTA